MATGSAGNAIGGADSWSVLLACCCCGVMLPCCSLRSLAPPIAAPGLVRMAGCTFLTAQHRARFSCNKSQVRSVGSAAQLSAVSEPQAKCWRVLSRLFLLLFRSFLVRLPFVSLFSLSCLVLLPFCSLSAPFLSPLCSAPPPAFCICCARVDMIGVGLLFQVLVCSPCSARSLARLIPRNDDDDDVPNGLGAITKASFDREGETHRSVTGG